MLSEQPSGHGADTPLFAAQPYSQAMLRLWRVTPAAPELARLPHEDGRWLDTDEASLTDAARDWVHLQSKYRQAAETLRAVQQAAEQVPSVADPVMSAELVRLARDNVERARRWVAAVEAQLACEFNLRQGVSER